VLTGVRLGRYSRARSPMFGMVRSTRPPSRKVVRPAAQIRAQIIWAKERLVLGRGDYHWQHEPCRYAVKGNGRWNGDRKQTTLWEVPMLERDGRTFGEIANERLKDIT
jgi:hypothetical protein